MEGAGPSLLFPPLHPLVSVSTKFAFYCKCTNVSLVRYLLEADEMMSTECQRHLPPLQLAMADTYLLNEYLFE